jgi:hypothetical protein
MRQHYMPKSMRVGKATQLNASGASKKEIDSTIEWSSKANLLSTTSGERLRARRRGSRANISYDADADDPRGEESKT